MPFAQGTFTDEERNTFLFSRGKSEVGAHLYSSIRLNRLAQGNLESSYFMSSSKYKKQKRSYIKHDLYTTGANNSKCPNTQETDGHD